MILNVNDKIKKREIICSIYRDTPCVCTTNKCPTNRKG